MIIKRWVVSMTAMVGSAAIMGYMFYTDQYHAAALSLMGAVPNLMGSIIDSEGMWRTANVLYDLFLALMIFGCVKWFAREIGREVSKHQREDE